MTKSNLHKAAKFTVPGMDETTANRVISTLDNRMVALLDLALTLKHVHWNVVGPNFISVHEMLDPQVEHLGALDLVYNGVNSDHRKALIEMGELDPVSEDMLIGQLIEMEQFQWFIRAHLESSDGDLVTVNNHTESGAAKSARS